MTLGDGLDEAAAVGVDGVGHVVADGGDVGSLPFLFQAAGYSANDNLPAIVGLDSEEAALGLDDKAGWVGQVVSE